MPPAVKGGYRSPTNKLLPSETGGEPSPQRSPTSPNRRRSRGHARKGKMRVLFFGAYFRYMYVILMGVGSSLPMNMGVKCTNCNTTIPKRGGFHPRMQTRVHHKQTRTFILPNPNSHVPVQGRTLAPLAARRSPRWQPTCADSQPPSRHRGIRRHSKSSPGRSTPRCVTEIYPTVRAATEVARST